jgi:hypothetical protein
MVIASLPPIALYIVVWFCRRGLARMLGRVTRVSDSDAVSMSTGGLVGSLAALPLGLWVGRVTIAGVLDPSASGGEILAFAVIPFAMVIASLCGALLGGVVGGSMRSGSRSVRTATS